MTQTSEMVGWVVSTLGAAVAAAFAWAWQINGRVATVEAKQEASRDLLEDVRDDVRGVGEKLDRLIERLM